MTVLNSEGADELTPPEINAFEYRWLSGLAVGVLASEGVRDCRTDRPAALLTWQRTDHGRGSPLR